MTPVVLENDRLRATFLPELGGKLASLISTRSGREHLLQPPEHDYRAAKYGADFSAFDTSGFDECFPTVGACAVRGTPLPDHGELWSVPWMVLQHTPETLLMSVAGRVFPYEFRRRATLVGSRLELQYEVVNTGTTAFPYLWSAHPLLRVEEGDKVILAEDCSSFRVEWSSGDRLAGDVAWDEDLAEMIGPQNGTADKLFSKYLTHGWCGLDYANGGGSLTFSFEPETIPFVGLWICQGGWPGEGRPPHFTVALEPCTADVDRLDEAVARSTAKVLSPGQADRWRMALEVSSERSSALRSDTTHTHNLRVGS